MKKILIVFGLSGALLLTACSKSANATNETENLKKQVESLKNEVENLKSENDSLKSKAEKFDSLTARIKEEENKKREEASKTEFKADEEWVVDGLFKLTVHSAQITDERNEFSDKTPKQVVKITYSYENIGYKSDIQDLFITPENVIDGSGEMASTYPIDTNPAHPTPIGAKMKDAQEAYGLNNESKEIKVNFKIYGNNYDRHDATFTVPVK